MVQSVENNKSVPSDPQPRPDNDDFLARSEPPALPTDPPLGLIPVPPAPSDESIDESSKRPPEPPLPGQLIMSVEQFEKATAEKFNLGRSDAYKQTVEALSNYHAILDSIRLFILPKEKEHAETLKELFQKMNEEVNKMHAQANEKSSLLRNMKMLVDDLAQSAATLEEAENGSENYSKAKKQNDDHRKNMLDQRHRIELAAYTLKKATAEKDKLLSDINNHMQARQGTRNIHLPDLNTAAEALKQTVLAYQETKKDSTNSDKRNAIENLIAALQSQDSSEVNIRAVATQVNEIPFGNQLQSAMDPLPSSTVSTVFRVRLNALIEDSGTLTGFAKVSAVKTNSTTDNLFPDLGDPDILFSDVKSRQFRNALSHKIFIDKLRLQPGELEELLPDNSKITMPALIARQVVSFRIDRLLGTNVLAAEVFSRAHDGATLGVTAEASGKQLMESSSPQRQGFRYFNFARPEIQRGLADLQIIDAINGQADRHGGNIFIDPSTERVTGIDNDMAYPMARIFDEGSNNALQEQFIYDVNGELTYTQNLISSRTAEAIISLSREELESVLRGQEEDPERMDELSIRNTLLRFDAVKRQCQKLKKDNALIKDDKWNVDTFNAAINSGMPAAPQQGFSVGHTNYLRRTIDQFLKAKNEDNVIQDYV